jgi:hypothetical protein
MSTGAPAIHVYVQINAIPTTSQDHWLNVVKNDDDGSKVKTPADAANTQNAQRTRQ